MIDEEGYLSVVHCVLALESVRELLAKNTFTPKSICSLLKDLCTGQRVPELDFKLKNLADNTNEGPSALIKPLVSEVLSISSNSYVQSMHLIYQFLASHEIPHLDSSKFEQHKIAIVEIQWEKISMKLSLKMLSNLKADAFIFTNGLYYIALTKENNQSWVIFDTAVTSCSSFDQAIKSLIVRNMYPKVAFNCYISSLPNLSIIQRIADKVDNTIQFKLSGQNRKDKLPPRYSSKCNKYNKDISGPDYECKESKSINWDKFYHIKGIDYRKDEPNQIRKTNSEKEFRNKPLELTDKAPVSPQTSYNHILRKNSYQGLYQNPYPSQDIHSSGPLSTHLRKSQIANTSDSKNPYANVDESPYMNSSKNMCTNATGNPYRNAMENPYRNAMENPYQNAMENPYRNAMENPYRNTMENPYRNTSENPYRNATENPYTNATGNPYTNATGNPYRNIMENPHMNATENPYRNAMENPYRNALENSYSNASENSFRFGTENPYRNASENPYRNATENSYTKLNGSTYANDSINFHTNVSENTLENPYQNLQKKKYIDSDSIKRRNSLQHERSGNPKFMMNYRPINESSAGQELHDQKYSSCPNNELQGDGTCQTCGSPNFSYSKNCWKCGNRLMAETKRRSKRDFTFGKEL